MYLILHSYELIALLWLLIWGYSLSNVWKAVAIGLTQHLVFDQIANPLKWNGYFFVYRAAGGFRKDHIMRRKEG